MLSFLPQGNEDIATFQSINQEFGGLGIQIEGVEDSTELRIITPVLGSPALEQGLQAGDIIVKIGDLYTKDIPQDESLDLLRGPEDTSVHITISREGVIDLLDFEVTRKIIRTISKAKRHCRPFRASESPSVEMDLF